MNTAGRSTFRVIAVTMNSLIAMITGAILYDNGGYILVEPVRPTDVEIMEINREKIERQMDRNEERIERDEQEWRRHEERVREFEEDLKDR